MGYMQGYLVDPLGAFTSAQIVAEEERRSRLAYRAWVEACERAGVTVSKRWEDLLEDEQGQWCDVYGVVCRVETDRQAGIDPPPQSAPPTK